MIPVSEGFKRAIKAPERKIKGYVEVLYDLPELETTVNSYITSSYTSTDEINNGKRVTNHLASLDYLPLDGSYITVSNYVTNTGYVSDELYSNISTPEFTISWTTATTIKGLTLYFRTNIPTGLTIDYSDGSQDVITDNDKEILQIIFDEPKTINSVIVYIDSMEYSDRKVYIDEVDLGVTQVYKDQDLIEFTVDEEVNKLVEEVPVNETNVILNNMSDLFNPLNPSGIVPYLSENTLIKPYVGVQTANSGIQYVKMGEFYFDSYTNNSDATTTLVGKNIIKKLSQEMLQSEDQQPDYLTGEYYAPVLIQRILSNYGNKYETNILDYRDNDLVSLIGTSKTNLLDNIKDIVFSETETFYADRDNKLNMKIINTTASDSLTKNELINDVEFKKIEQINCIQKKIFNGSKATSVSGDAAKVYEGTITLDKSTEYVLIEFNQECNYSNLTLSRTGGTSASIIDANNKLCFVALTGNVGDSISITIKSNTLYTNNYIESTKDISTGQKNILKLDSSIGCSDNDYSGNEDYYLYKARLFDIAPSYEIRFDYNGDPSLESGDYIEVETPYGFKPLFIQKHRIKFDGGLEGSIEGVE